MPSKKEVVSTAAEHHQGKTSATSTCRNADELVFGSPFVNPMLMLGTRPGAKRLCKGVTAESQ